MDSKIMREEKGQAAVQTFIGTGALVFVGILVIAQVFSGAGVGYIQNEALGNMTGNLTDFTADFTPMSQHSSHTPVLSNTTTEFNLGDDITTGCTVPCFAVTYDSGNISVNATYPDQDPTTNELTLTYYESDVEGTGLTTLVTVEGYLWVGMGFLGLGLLVLGAIFVLRIIRQMGG